VRSDPGDPGDGRAGDHERDPLDDRGSETDEEVNREVDEYLRPLSAHRVPGPAPASEHADILDDHRRDNELVGEPERERREQDDRAPEPYDDDCGAERKIRPPPPTSRSVPIRAAPLPRRRRARPTRSVRRRSTRGPRRRRTARPPAGGDRGTAATAGPRSSGARRKDQPSDSRDHRERPRRRRSRSRRRRSSDRPAYRGRGPKRRRRRPQTESSLPYQIPRPQRPPRIPQFGRRERESTRRRSRFRPSIRTRKASFAQRTRLNGNRNRRVALDGVVYRVDGVPTHSSRFTANPYILCQGDRSAYGSFSRSFYRSFSPTRSSIRRPTALYAFTPNATKGSHEGPRRTGAESAACAGRTIRRDPSSVPTVDRSEVSASTTGPLTPTHRRLSTSARTAPGSATRGTLPEEGVDDLKDDLREYARPQARVHPRRRTASA